MINRSIILIFIPLLLAVIFSCTRQDIAGNGTQSGNPVISGRLFGPDGTTPAANAVVRLRPRGSLSLGIHKKTADSATVRTDHNGSYSIHAVDPGTYTIEYAGEGDNRALHDHVIIENADTTLALPPDTLRPAGTVRGNVRLAEGGDYRKIYVLIFGIDRFVTVNEDGSFTIANLAEASYDLRLVSALSDYGMHDTSGVAVTSADTTTLPPVELPFTGTPQLRDLHLTYDTLRQAVSLSWKQPDPFTAIGVNIYRCETGAAGTAPDPVKINDVPVAGTMYIDSLARQDHAYSYRVAIVKKDSTETARSPEQPVFIAGYFTIETTFTGFMMREPEGKRKQQHFFTADENGILYIVDRSKTGVLMFDTAFSEKGILRDSLLQSAGDVAVCPANDLVYVADLNDATGFIRRVLLFNSEGTMVKNVPVSGTDNPAASAPLGFDAVLFTTDSRGRMFFVSGRQDSLCIADTAGNIIRRWGGFGDGTGRGDNCGISCIMVDNTDNLHLYDFDRGISVYDTAGTMLRFVNQDSIRRKYTNSATFEVFTGRMEYINGMCADPVTGGLLLLTADALLPLDQDDRLITGYSFAALGTGSEAVTFPYGLVAVGRKIYVVHTGFDLCRITVLARPSP